MMKLKKCAMCGVLIRSKSLYCAPCRYDRMAEATRETEKKRLEKRRKERQQKHVVV